MSSVPQPRSSLAGSDFARPPSIPSGAGAQDHPHATTALNLCAPTPLHLDSVVGSEKTPPLSRDSRLLMFLPLYTHVEEPRGENQSQPSRSFQPSPPTRSHARTIARRPHISLPAVPLDLSSSCHRTTNAATYASAARRPAPIPPAKSVAQSHVWIPAAAAAATAAVRARAARGREQGGRQRQRERQRSLP